MEGVKCNEVAGAVYAFPRITLSQKAIEEAKVNIPNPFLYLAKVARASEDTREGRARRRIVFSFARRFQRSPYNRRQNPLYQ